MLQGTWKHYKNNAWRDEPGTGIRANLITIYNKVTIFRNQIHFKKTHKSIVNHKF
jgi:hypothetical protein